MVSKYIGYVLIALIICFASRSTYFSNIYAADINATITTGLFVPLKPLNLAISIDDGSVDLSWSPPSSNGGSVITDYLIEYQLSSGGVWATFADGVSTNATTTVTGLINDTSYDFRVSAINIIGQGPPSTEVTATPGSPAQVLVLSVSDTSVPSIVAAVRITNEGTTAYEYQYTWCVTDSDVNLCGGGDDLFTASGAVVIQPGEDWDASLPSTVSTRGEHWFHLAVSFGSDTSHARQSFTAVSASRSGGSSSSSGSSRKFRSCVGADLNRDGKVNLVDFSILIMFYNALPPFGNPCADINNDSKVSVVDFSILLTQWEQKPTPFKITP